MTSGAETPEHSRQEDHLRFSVERERPLLPDDRDESLLRRICWRHSIMTCPTSRNRSMSLPRIAGHSYSAGNAKIYLLDLRIVLKLARRTLQDSVPSLQHIGVVRKLQS